MQWTSSDPHHNGKISLIGISDALITKVVGLRGQPSLSLRNVMSGSAVICLGHINRGWVPSVCRTEANTDQAQDTPS
jgi:hypothetical protein